MKNDFREFYDVDYIIHSLDDALKHHGIKGMHWGERNGPPYPLDSSISTGKSLKTNATNNKKAKNDDQDKQGIIIIPVSLATYVAAYAIAGGVLLSADASAKVREKSIQKEISKCKTDPKTKLPLKDKEYTLKQDVKDTNPGFNKLKNDEYANNCVRCSCALELRRRGYNVTAAKSVDGMPGGDVMKKLFGAKEPKYVDGYGKPKTALKDFRQSKEWQERKVTASKGKSKAYEATVNMLKREKDSRGQMLVTWPDGLSGHSFMYEVKNGKVTFMDGQCGKIYNEFQAKNLFKYVVMSRYQRLDNCKTINKSYLKEVVNEYRG